MENSKKRTQYITLQEASAGKIKGKVTRSSRGKNLVVAKKEILKYASKKRNPPKARQHLRSYGGGWTGKIAWPSSVKRGGGFAGIFLLVVIGMNLSFLWANTRVFYPAACAGDWEQPQLAQGEPELSADDPVEAFNETNSAVLRQGTGVQIFCKEFQGEWPENLLVRDAKLRLSFAVTSAPEESDQIPSEESQEPSTPAVPEGLVPSPEEAGQEEVPLEESPSIEEEQLEPAASSNEEAEPPVSEEAPSKPEVIEEQPVDQEAVEKEAIPSSSEEVPADISALWNMRGRAILRAFWEVGAQSAESPQDAQTESPEQPPVELFESEDSSEPERPAVPPEAPQSEGGEQPVEAPDPSVDEEVQFDPPAGGSAEGVVEQPAPPAEDFLEISYSFGGSDWVSVATINQSNWSGFTIPLPGIATEFEIANLQIRLEGLPGANGVPTVYLDAMEVEV